MIFLFVFIFAVVSLTVGIGGYFLLQRMKKEPGSVHTMLEEDAMSKVDDLWGNKYETFVKPKEMSFLEAIEK